MSYASLGLDIPTPAGPITVPVAPLANEAFEAVWPTMQQRLREEMSRERKITFLMVGGAVGVVLGANWLLSKV